ncbi:MAG: OmpH family outer membrane protein [Nitrospiraceae bacterium]|nr:OmpH family outer membrane protein [Nitrospiraceae bacterium]
MKKILITVLVLLLPVAAFAADIKIGYVDLQKALNESNAGKEAKTDLEDAMKKIQGDIDKKVAEREKLKAELDKQALVLSPEAKREKADQIDKLERETERMINDANVEMQKRQRQKEVAILQGIKGVIDSIGKKENYLIILPADVILYSKGGIELTDRVIDTYNKETAAAPKGKK